MPGPVQHLNTITVPGRATLNADYPTGIANVWTGDVVTDPSTNNQPLGRPIRNMLNSNNPGTPVPRVVRAGGSGRPQIREFDGAAADCTCTHYAGMEGEFVIDFTICSFETFPLDFSARWGASAGGTLIAPGPQPPTQSEINAIWQLVNSSLDEPISSTTSAHCSDLQGETLVAYYRFEDDLTDSGPNHVDLSDALFIDPATFGPGKINEGMVTSGGLVQGIIGDVFTVGAWLFCDGLNFGPGPQIDIVDLDLAEALLISLSGNGDGTVNLTVDGDITYDLGLALTGWNHVAIAYDSGTQGVYLNGVFVSSAPVRTAGSDLDGVAFITKGGDSDGKADEAGIWNVALSALEIEVLYHGGDGFDPTM